MLDQTTGMLTVIAPSATALEKGTAVESGTVVLAGVTPGGTSVSGVLFVGVVKTVDLSAAGVANSYMASVKETNYLFDVMHKGDGSPLATDHLGVIWKSASGLVQYLQMENGKASFYIGADTEDSNKILKGNAVIGAYDANDELIWSWHVWATDYDPEGENGSVELNGYTMMTRNLGALANGNATTSEILASYGLYYQWGRKDPFIGPSTYKISSGQGAAMYNDSGSRTYVTMVASSAETGTMDYAVKHPLTFVTGVAESNNDWLWSKSDAGWSSDGDAGAKSVNDPCPYGWRVAPSAAFAGLEIVDDHELLRPQAELALDLVNGPRRGLAPLGVRVPTVDQFRRGQIVRAVVAQDVLRHGVAHDADVPARGAKPVQQVMHAGERIWHVRAHIVQPRLVLDVHLHVGKAQNVAAQGAEARLERVGKKVVERHVHVRPQLLQRLHEGRIIDGRGAVDDRVVVVEHQALVAHARRLLCLTLHSILP